MLPYSKFIGLFLALLFVCVLPAQEFPYQLDWGREAALLGSGVTVKFGSHRLEHRLKGLNPAELRAKRRSNVWFLDRGATYNESEDYRTLSDRLLRTAALLPATLLVNRTSRRKVLIIATMLGETMLLNDGLTRTTKAVIRRDRPLTYNLSFADAQRTTEDARKSFVSGHTSNTAALSFFTAKVFHDVYPESPWRPVVWTAAAAVPLVTGYARYRAGKHFPTDIAAGYALGAALGILIPHWHKGSDPKGLRVGMSGDGLGLSLRW